MKSSNLEKALEYLRSVTNRPRMEVQQASILLKLHSLQGEPVTMQDLEKRTPGTSQSIISRNCHAFGAKSKLGAKRLIDVRICEDDIRFRAVCLSVDGLEVMNTFCGIANGSMKVPLGTKPAVDTRTQFKA